MGNLRKSEGVTKFQSSISQPMNIQSPQKYRHSTGNFLEHKVTKRKIQKFKKKKNSKKKIFGGEKKGRIEKKIKLGKK